MRDGAVGAGAKNMIYYSVSGGDGPDVGNDASGS